MMSHKEWGVQRRSLLNVSKIDYGARASIFKKLDPIHDWAIRMSTGAYKSSPIDSILVEVGTPSLENRRNRMRVNFAYKRTYKTYHPVKSLMYSDQNAQKYNRLKNPTKPTVNAASGEQLPIQHKERASFEFVDHLSKQPKSTTLPVFYKTEYIKVCKMFPDIHRRIQDRDRV